MIKPCNIVLDVPDIEAAARLRWALRCPVGSLCQPRRA